MSTREGQTFGGASRFVHYINLVKLPHTVFALPFALVGATLASYDHQITIRQIAWIIVAFTSARFAAMAFNRLIDRDVDALNPRTRSREIPSGVISVSGAVTSILVAAAVFVLAAYELNWLCFVLSPVALLWVLGYSYTKRFTRWAHLVLGLGLGIAPAGGYLAISGQWPEPWWLLPALAIAVMSWVGGFDILYALQDEEFDRLHGLHSLPASLGRARAIAVSRALHVVTVLALSAAAVGAGGGWLFWSGVVVAALLLAWEHRLVRADDLSKLDAAFFTMNGVISITFFGFVLAERLVR